MQGARNREECGVPYRIIVFITIGLTGYEQMMSIIVLTVLLSIFLHGITAVPLSRLYAVCAADSGVKQHIAQDAHL